MDIQTENKGFYSASQVVALKVFKYKSVRAFTLFLQTDKGKELFNPIVKPGKQPRYSIPVEKVEALVKSIQEGTLTL